MEKLTKADIKKYKINIRYRYTLADIRYSYYWHAVASLTVRDIEYDVWAYYDELEEDKYKVEKRFPCHVKLELNKLLVSSNN